MENSQNTQAAAIQAGGRDADITTIIEQVVERVRHILDQFEQVVDEVFNVIDMIRELFREVRDLFRMRGASSEEDAGEYLEYAH